MKLVFKPVHLLVYFVSLTVNTEYNNEACSLLCVTYLFLGDHRFSTKSAVPQKLTICID